MRLRIGDQLVLDMKRRVLLRGADEVVPLQPKSYRVLAMLIEHRNRVVTKEELLATLWPAQTVVPDVLTSSLRAVRRALDDSATDSRFIRTVHGAGYQFVAPVELLPARSQEDTPALEARHEAFVARTRELDALSAMLTGESSVQLVHISGPPGIGKTSLLQEVAYVAAHHAIEHCWLRGDEAGPFSDGFLRALGRTLGIGGDVSLNIIRERFAGAGRFLLLVDDFHQIPGVDEWCRCDLWPALPATVRIVLAGRAPASGRWRRDPAFVKHGLALELNPFDTGEAAELLATRRLSADRIEHMCHVTRGLPLALALWADVSDGQRIELLDHTDLVDTLVASFTDSVRDAAQLRALEAASLLDEISERALASLLVDADDNAVADRMRWLCALPFATRVRDGVRLHALVREAVIAQLARTAPTRFSELLMRGFRFGLERLECEEDAAARLRAASLMFSMGRHNPLLRAQYQTTDEGVCFAEPASEEARAELLASIERHEGPASVSIHERWLAHPYTQTWVMRDGEHRAVGFAVLLRLGTLPDARSEGVGDPAVDAIHRFLAEEGLAREGEEMIVARTTLDCDQYQALTHVTKQCSMTLGFAHVWHCTHAPQVAHNFHVYSVPELWGPVMMASRFRVLHHHAVELEGRHFVPMHLSIHDYPLDRWFQSFVGDITTPSSSLQP